VLTPFGFHVYWCLEWSMPIQMDFNNLTIKEMRSRVLGWVREIIRTMGDVSAKFINQMKHLLFKDCSILFVNVVN